jgi:hypothetical protein
MFSCSFVELSRQIGQFPTKKPDSLLPRFLQILNDHTLVKRVNRETRGDIVGYKIRPWTRHEHLSLMQLVRNNGPRCDASQCLTKYPLLFHPCRTSSSVSATDARLRSRGHNFEDVLAQFREFCQAIHKDSQNLALLDLPCDLSRIDEFTADACEKVNKLAVKPDATLQSLRERTVGVVSPSAFGVT